MLAKVGKDKSYTGSAVSAAPARIFSLDDYRVFLKAKASVSEDFGFEIDRSDVNPICKPHQIDAICWAVRGGRRALFARFGLGKSIMQLEVERLILSRVDGLGLIVAPLGVRQEFKRDAAKLGFEIAFVRTNAEVAAINAAGANPSRIYLTNYESVRDGKLDPAQFAVTSLDEAAVLRSFGGTKTFREFMRVCESVSYRFVATATPSPNSYIELAAYAGFLGIMDISQIKTRFFQRNSEKADDLTVYSHKQEEWWGFISTWGLFLSSPSDLCRCGCHGGDYA